MFYYISTFSNAVYIELITSPVSGVARANHNQRRELGKLIGYILRVNARKPSSRVSRIFYILYILYDF